MNLTAHIVRKDLFRLRWVLLLWVMVLTGRMVLAHIQAALDEGGYYPFYISAWIFGAIFLPLLTFGLVMGVQDDDAVSDSDAFWITRPISGARLLGAKAVVLVLLWLVPALTMMPWWLAHGFDGHQLGAAAFQVTRWQVVLTLLAVPFAIISANGSRFIMSVLLVAAGLFILILVSGLFGFGSAPALSPAAAESRTWVIVLLWTTAVLAMALVQYLTRRTRISLVILMLALVAGCAAARGWSWEIFPAARNSADAARNPAPAFQLNPGSFLRGLTIHLEYAAKAGEADQLVLTGEVTHRLAWPNDSFSAVSPPAAADQLAAAGATLALGAATQPMIQSDFTLGHEAQRERLLREPPSYRATFEGEMSRLELAAVLPAQTGESDQRGGQRVKIAEIMANDSRGFAITVTESAPDFAADPWLGLFDRPARLPTKEFYFLVNRADGRTSLATAAPTGESLSAAMITYRRTLLIFGPPASWNWDAATFNRWAHTATLVKVAAHSTGPFSAEVDVARLAVNPSGPAAK